MKKKLGLFSATLLSVGAVIGFGIFFKVDNILVVNGANSKMAILSWILVGLIITFGAYSIGKITHNLPKAGGFGDYIKYFYGTKLGFFATWFALVIYVPVYVAMLCKYFGYYFGLLMQNDGSGDYFFGLLIMGAIALTAFLSQRVSVGLTNVTSLVKFFPLAAIFIIGIVFGDISNLSTPSATSTTNTEVSTYTSSLLVLIAPFIAMYHTFDGWISVSSLSHRIENPKENMQKVFVTAVLIALVLYVLFFTGVLLLFDANNIVNSGDMYLFEIFTTIFGDVGVTIAFTFVIISGVGAINSFFLSGLGYVEEVAEEKFIPMHTKFKPNGSKFSGNAILLVFGLSFIYFILFFLQDYAGIIQGLNIEDWMLSCTSVIYLMIFAAIIRYSYVNKFERKKLIPSATIAFVGQFLIVLSYLITNEMASVYFVIGLIIVILGYFINKNFNREFNVFNSNVN